MTCQAPRPCAEQVLHADAQQVHTTIHLSQHAQRIEVPQHGYAAVKRSTQRASMRTKFQTARQGMQHPVHELILHVYEARGVSSSCQTASKCFATSSIKSIYRGGHGLAVPSVCIEELHQITDEARIPEGLSGAKLCPCCRPASLKVHVTHGTRACARHICLGMRCLTGTKLCPQCTLGR